MATKRSQSNRASLHGVHPVGHLAEPHDVWSQCRLTTGGAGRTVAERARPVVATVAARAPCRPEPAMQVVHPLGSTTLVQVVDVLGHQVECPHRGAVPGGPAPRAPRWVERAGARLAARRRSGAPGRGRRRRPRGVATVIGSWPSQSPAASRNVGRPLWAETPAPVSTTTFTAAGYPARQCRTRCELFSGTRGCRSRSARRRPIHCAGCRAPGCRRCLEQRATCIRFHVMNAVLRLVKSFSGPPEPGSRYDGPGPASPIQPASACGGMT